MYTRIWVDLLLLSESHACVFARSGFPRIGCGASSRMALQHGQMNEWLPFKEHEAAIRHHRPIPELQCDSWHFGTGE